MTTWGTSSFFLDPTSCATIGVVAIKIPVNPVLTGIHIHVPEIEQMLAEWNRETKPITFSTHLIPISRGIMVTLYAKVKREMEIEQLQKLYEETYEQSAFVRIRMQGEFPSPKEVRGSNYCDMGIAYDERTGRVTVVSVIDNMMKGAAGQAIQNANIIAGLEETTGLQHMPLYL